MYVRLILGVTFPTDCHHNQSTGKANLITTEVSIITEKFYLEVFSNFEIVSHSPSQSSIPLSPSLFQIIFYFFYLSHSLFLMSSLLISISIYPSACSTCTLLSFVLYLFFFLLLSKIHYPSVIRTEKRAPTRKLNTDANNTFSVRKKRERGEVKFQRHSNKWKLLFSVENFCSSLLFRLFIIIPLPATSLFLPHY